MHTCSHIHTTTHAQTHALTYVPTHIFDTHVAIRVSLHEHIQLYMAHTVLHTHKSHTQTNTHTHKSHTQTNTHTHKNLMRIRSCLSSCINTFKNMLRTYTLFCKYVKLCARYSVENVHEKIKSTTCKYQICLFIRV